MTKSVNVSALLDSCNKLDQRTYYVAGCLRYSKDYFEACMQAFNSPSVEAVSYSIFFDAPVWKYGEASLYRDGHMTMHTV